MKKLGFIFCVIISSGLTFLGMRMSEENTEYAMFENARNLANSYRPYNDRMKSKNGLEPKCNVSGHKLRTLQFAYTFTKHKILIEAENTMKNKINNLPLLERIKISFGYRTVILDNKSEIKFAQEMKNVEAGNILKFINSCVP